MPEAVRSSWNQLETGSRSVRTSLQTEGFAVLSDPRLSNPSQDEEEVLLWSREELWVKITVCPRLQLTSHTQPTSTLSRIKCARYIFIKKCVRSLKFVYYIRLCFHLYLYMYVAIQYIYIYIYIWTKIPTFRDWCEQKYTHIDIRAHVSECLYVYCRVSILKINLRKLDFLLDICSFTNAIVQEQYRTMIEKIAYKNNWVSKTWQITWY